MYHDVSELRNFYYRTHLGRSAQKRLQEQMAKIWQEPKHDCLVGFGFATPFLRPFTSGFKNVVNLMPEGQGVMAWPPAEKNISVLCNETVWPLGAGVANHMVIAHAIECCEDVSGLMEEIWRVLAPEGKVIFVLSNRMGVWANSDSTPLGFGRPYSFRQAERLLLDHQFEIMQCNGALYAPPLSSRLGLKSVKLMEWALGGRSRRLFAGALVIEARKRVGILPPKLRVREPIFATPALATHANKNIVKSDTAKGRHKG